MRTINTKVRFLHVADFCVLHECIHECSATRKGKVQRYREIETDRERGRDRDRGRDREREGER